MNIKAINYSARKAPSQISEGVLNTPLSNNVLVKWNFKKRKILKLKNEKTGFQFLRKRFKNNRIVYGVTKSIHFSRIDFFSI